MKVFGSFAVLGAFREGAQLRIYNATEVVSGVQYSFNCGSIPYSQRLLSEITEHNATGG